MNKTIFSVSKMDCPSEEQLIRMKLEGLNQIRSLKFDPANRKLMVIHTGNYNEISDLLERLHLGTSLEATSFADSLDMLADSFVYGLALFATGKMAKKKKLVARVSGFFQIFLAATGFAEAIRRFFEIEEAPDFQTMIIISLLALTGNAVCLFLLQKSKSREVHMQASMIFTSNDVLANLGVILAGVLVYLTSSKYPDLLIGTLVFILVGFGSIRILKLSKNLERG